MTPFRVRRMGRVVELALDTPGACVNVFGHQAAAQLDAVLSSPPHGVTTLLLRSKKVGSFVNGAGLLYANAMGSTAHARSVSAPVRAVYERLAASPLRTVAFIEGNCFGCGLELALACDVRIARNTAEVMFRMTELTEYRFVPLFGGTWRLPRRVGVEPAARLLLDGETWHAEAALEHRLVDHVLDVDAPEADLMALVSLQGGPIVPAHPPARVVPARRPPARREVPSTRAAVWKTVEALLDAASTESPQTCRRREVSAFARTVTAPAAKNAMGFFFVRYAARAASFGSADRVVPDVTLRMDAHAEAAAARVAWRRLVEARTVVPTQEVVLLTAVSPRLARAGGVSVFFPHGLGVPFCEVSARRSDVERARAIGRALVWLGVETVVSFGEGEHVSRVLLERTRRARRRLAAAGITPASISRALWDLGFAAPLRSDAGHGTYPDAIGAPGAVEALASTWEETLTEAVRAGILEHASQGDVLVHELFDFPVELGSFARWRALGRAQAAQRSADSKDRGRWATTHC